MAHKIEPFKALLVGLADAVLQGVLSTVLATIGVIVALFAYRSDADCGPPCIRAAEAFTAVSFALVRFLMGYFGARLFKSGPVANVFIAGLCFVTLVGAYFRFNYDSSFLLWLFLSLSLGMAVLGAFARTKTFNRTTSRGERFA